MEKLMISSINLWLWIHREDITKVIHGDWCLDLNFKNQLRKKC